MMLQDLSRLATERIILRQLKIALHEEWRGRRRGCFMAELRGQIRTQGFRIAALERAFKQGEDQ